MATKGGGLRFEGSFTTDGAGAATVDMVIPAAATKARAAGPLSTTGWRVLRAVIGNAHLTTPLTGGTAVLKDNAGAGQTILTFTQATDGTKKEMTAPDNDIVGNLRITVAGGGASKVGQYLVEVG
jgi:hypothetical protein